MFAYVGGKSKQAKWISKYIPADIERYAEVFGGAMWTYINGNINVDDVRYNDFNSQMANLLFCCSQYDTFIPILDARVSQSKENIIVYDEEFYRCKEDVLKVIKSGNNIDMPDFELAAKYVYVITQCFSGIMSENVKYINLKGKYNSKYNSFRGRVKNLRVQNKLEKIKATSLTFEEFIPTVDGKKTLLYLDPPYYGTENLYAFHNFTKDKHKELADMLNQCESNWVLSYYEFPEMHEWYPKSKYKWIDKEYKKGSMAAKGKQQSVGTELLIIKK